MIDTKKRQMVKFYPLKKNAEKWSKLAKKSKKSRGKYLEEALEVFHTQTVDK